MVKDHKMFLEIWLEKSREGDGALEEFIFTNFKSIIDKYDRVMVRRAIVKRLNPCAC